VSFVLFVVIFLSCRGDISLLLKQIRDCGWLYPVPQNALYVSAGMNVLKFPKGKP